MTDSSTPASTTGASTTGTSTTGDSSPGGLVGVIGGSGFYEFFSSADEVTVQTPYGEPSDPVMVGEVAGRRVAFLPRHGRDHRFPPHRIPYRANMWALRSLGVRQVLAPSAVGSLTMSYGPGTLVIPDQLVDSTTGRDQTYYDAGGAVHVPFADRYCPVGRLGARLVRHARGHRRPALLHPRRVPVVRGAGLDAGRHDRPARGGAGPRARALLHLARAGHRHRRGGGRGGRGHPRRGARGVRRERAQAQEPGREGHREPAHRAHLPLPGRTGRHQGPVRAARLTPAPDKRTLNLASPPRRPGHYSRYRQQCRPEGAWI